MRPKLYPDLNFLIDALNAGDQYQTMLAGVAALQTQFVISHWHLVELARAKNPAPLVKLVLELQPAYLHERTVILRKSIRDKVNQVLGITNSVWEPIGTLEDVIIGLSGPIEAGKTLRLDDVISILRMNQAPIESGYAANRDARDSYLRAMQSNAVSAEMKHNSNEKYLLQFFPEKVLRGNVVGLLEHTTKLELLKKIDFSDIRVAVVEDAVTEDGHRPDVKLRKQTFFDRQHMILALPYTDFVVTGDKAFASLVERVRLRLPFEVAQVITRHEFEEKFSITR